MTELPPHREARPARERGSFTDSTPPQAAPWCRPVPLRGQQLALGRARRSYQSRSEVPKDLISIKQRGNGHNEWSAVLTPQEAQRDPLARLWGRTKSRGSSQVRLHRSAESCVRGSLPVHSAAGRRRSPPRPPIGRLTLLREGIPLCDQEGTTDFQPFSGRHARSDLCNAGRSHQNDPTAMLRAVVSPNPAGTA